MENNLKYLAIGILAGYLAPYLLALIKKPQSAQTQPNNSSTSEEEAEN